MIEKKAAYGIDEFCRAYAVKRSFVYQQIRLGRLRAHKIGSRTVIFVKDAQDWQDSLPQRQAAKAA
jgi:hypothetical protein